MLHLGGPAVLFFYCVPQPHCHESSVWGTQLPQWAPPGPLPCKSSSGLCQVSPPAQTVG